MKGQHSDIIATVSLFPTEVGGRQGPTPNDMYGCLMVIDNNNYDIKINLEDAGSIFPGQTVRVPVRFLDWERARESCSVGKRFILREVYTIGAGVIDEITLLDDGGGKVTYR